METTPILLGARNWSLDRPTFEKYHSQLESQWEANEVGNRAQRVQQYKPRTAIKAQALADFMVEWTIDNQEVGGQEIVARGGQEEVEKQGEDTEMELKEFWVLYFDGASKTKSSGARLVLQSPDGFTIEYALKLDFPTTNNEALIAGLGLTRVLRVKNLKVYGDSRLVVSQVNGEFETREENVKADALSKKLRVVRGVFTSRS